MHNYQVILDKSVWEDLVTNFPEANFLQAWNWGVFQENIGKSVLRMAFFSDDSSYPFALVEAVREKAKRGTYLTIAGGPLVKDWQNWHQVNFIFESIKLEARKLDCLFVRVRPQSLDTPELREIFKRLGLHLAPMHLTADLTLQLDISLSEDELLAQMRKNHRSTIKKALTSGEIQIEISSDPNEIKDFHNHQLKLAERQKFVPFSYDFFHQQFLAFVHDSQICLIHAKHQGNIIATAFVIFYNHEAVYHYGISTDLNRQFPGSYLVQWTAILEAKKRGCKRYNFWGITKPEATHHRFYTVSIFKRGFGGHEVAYLPAHDLPISKLYWITYIFERLRKKARHL